MSFVQKTFFFIPLSLISSRDLIAFKIFQVEEKKCSLLSLVKNMLAYKSKDLNYEFRSYLLHEVRKLNEKITFLSLNDKIDLMNTTIREWLLSVRLKNPALLRRKKRGEKRRIIEFL